MLAKTYSRGKSGDARDGCVYGGGGGVKLSLSHSYGYAKCARCLAGMYCELVNCETFRQSWNFKIFSHPEL